VAGLQLEIRQRPRRRGHALPCDNGNMLIFNVRSRWRPSRQHLSVRGYCTKERHQWD
jgi:hypothetical protein